MLAVEPGARPWDQLPDEGDKAFAGFLLYREMPRSDRSLLGASRGIYGERTGRRNQPQGRVQEWAETNSWKLRVQAYDRYLDRESDRIKADAARFEIEAMAKRQAQQAQAYQTLLVQPTLAALRRMSMSVEDPRSLAAMLANMTALELIGMAADTAGPFTQMVKLERLARGVSTENIDQHTKVSGGVNVDSDDGRFSGTAVTSDEPDDQHFTEVIAILLEAGVLKADSTAGVIDAKAHDLHSPQANIEADGVPASQLP